MDVEGDLMRPSPFDIHDRTLPGQSQQTPHSVAESKYLRQRNDDLEKENQELKRRLKGTHTLAFMLGDSEEKVKHLKQTVEQLTASRTSSISNGVNQLTLNQDYISNQSEKTQSHRISSQHITSRDSSMKSVNGLNSEVVSDSSPSDVDAEDQHNSNTEGNTSMHSQHDEPANSKSPDISPLQSIHSEEFRSGASNNAESSSQRRHVTSSTPEAAARGRSPAHTPEPSHIDPSSSIVVQNLETVINDLVGNEQRSALSPYLARTVTQVMKLERDNNTKTILSRNLMQENAELKTNLNRIKEEYDELLDHQREQITELKNTVRRLYADKENEDYQVVDKAQVEKAMKVTSSEKRESKEDEAMLTAAAHSMDNVEKLKKKISDLEKQNKEILQVNQQWDTHYKGMKSAMEAHINDLQRQLQDRDTENTRLRSSHSSSLDEQRQRDVDRMLLDARKRVEVEESARESAMEDLHQERQRSDTLNNRVGVLERQVTQLLQLKTGMETEIRRLNKALAETPPQPRTKQPDQLPIRNTEEMRSHIEALQAQVSVYKEDFENERRDRERIASVVDQLKNETENLKAERDTFAQQAHWYEEDFRREHEDKERLQRMLARRAVDDDYQFNVPVEKKAYPARQPEYYQPPAAAPPRDYYGQPRDQYIGAQQIPQPPPYYAHEQQPPQHRYNETQQGRLIRRGPGKEDRPNQYPKYGQNLARNDLEVDAGDNIDGEAVAADPTNLHGRSLKCPRCEREFQETDKFRQHVERCVS